jgi:hypothetical protein
VTTTHQPAPGSKVILADPEGSAALGAGRLHSLNLALCSCQTNPTVFCRPEPHIE